MSRTHASNYTVVKVLHKCSVTINFILNLRLFDTGVFNKISNMLFAIRFSIIKINMRFQMKRENTFRFTYLNTSYAKLIL